MSMASCPLVRNTRSSGRPMTADVTGSPMWAAGIHSRAPPARPGALPHIRQVHGIDPVGHLAHAAQVLPFEPAVRVRALTCLVSSIAPTARPRRWPVLRAASSSPATANLRTTPIAAQGSWTARLSTAADLGAWLCREDDSG